MREIKFRAFDRQGNWYYSNLDTISFWSGIGDGNLRLETLGQFTGLKDKNGKEIWEGDVVLHRSAGKQIIVWQDITGGWTIQTPGDNAVYLPSVDDMSNLEVIGNIYSNPELIK